ncbi:MAG TPA: metal ABC transporter permease [Opitutales bacterium]|nr:metal ABC transporter permease [Opitutales bacterium]
MRSNTLRTLRLISTITAITRIKLMDFFNALLNPNLSFLRYALLAGVLSSVAFGIVGSYVVTRQITSIAGAIAHCVLAGIGFSLYAQYNWGWAWCDPTLGAFASALISAGILGLISRYGHEREDTLIGALWAVGMAIGLVFLAKTPAYVDPMMYLFGNILLCSERDVWMVIGLDVIVLGITIALYQPLLAVCFDEQFARLRGVPVRLLYTLLLALTALTVVLLIRVVGIVMVIALLTLPAAIAGQCSKRLWQMMAWAAGLSALFVAMGLMFSYEHNLPSGPIIILVAGIVYLIVMTALTLFKRYRRREAMQRVAT